jgi:hypothetical protein
MSSNLSADGDHERGRYICRKIPRRQASLLEFISMKQSGARGFFLSRLKVGINGIR